MTYIYDILLNFNDVYYEFYDWYKEDKILHIKKMPIYKINNQDLKNILYGIVEFDMSFLENIRNKTEVFLKHDISNLKYSCLLHSDEKIIAINLDDGGKIIGKSDLLIDEYNEILNILEDSRLMEVKYSLKKCCDYDNFKTRKHKEKNNYIKKELDIFSKSELTYLYYELFFKNNDNIDEIKKELLSNVEQDRLYKLVKMIGSKYKKIK